MAKVNDIIQAKGNQIYSISPDSTVYSALEQLFEKNISALLVMEGEELAGIFTERDYARKVVLKGKSSKETLIKEIMTQNLITVTQENTIEDAMKIMTDNHIRHLPVKSVDKLIGIISIGDVVKHLIQEQKSIIGNLESYIKGT